MDLFLTSSANFAALAWAESGAVGQEVRNIFDRTEKYLFALAEKYLFTLARQEFACFQGFFQISFLELTCHYCQAC